MEVQLHNHGSPNDYQCNLICENGKQVYQVECPEGGPNFRFTENRENLIDAFAYTDSSGMKVFHLTYKINGKLLSVLLMIGYDLKRRINRVAGIRWWVGALNTC